MNRCLLTLLVCVMIVGPSCVVSAQEDEDVEFSYGVVVKVDVSSKEIVVSEYDYERDVENNISYSIDPDTKFEDGDSIKGIQKGDEISIDYIYRNGKRMARLISIYSDEYELEEEEEEETEYKEADDTDEKMDMDH